MFRADDWLPDRGYQLGYHQSVRYAGPVPTQVRRESALVRPPSFGKWSVDFAERRPVSKLSHQLRPAPALGLLAVEQEIRGGVSELFRRTFPRSSDTHHPRGWLQAAPLLGRDSDVAQVAGCTPGGRVQPQKKGGVQGWRPSLASREMGRALDTGERLQGTMGHPQPEPRSRPSGGPLTKHDGCSQ